MEQEYCRNCVHFKQHYHISGEYGFLIDCGHCVCPGLKHRKATAKACERFVKREKPELPDRKETIHYLTTKVLEYILELELPPIIKEEEMETAAR